MDPPEPESGNGAVPAIGTVTTRRSILITALAAMSCRNWAQATSVEIDRQILPILAYHRFDPAGPGSTTVTTTAFEAQLDWLTHHGRQIVRLREAIARLLQPPARLPPSAALTVDDGHRSVYTFLFPIIRRRKLPVTLFIYPSAISNASYAMTWEQLREMQASGLVDVGSHSYWHPNFNAERQHRTSADYRAFVDTQLRRSRQALETRLRTQVDMLAWPFGMVDAELEQAARAAGYKVGFTYGGGAATAAADPLAVPRIPIHETDRGERLAALLQPAHIGSSR